MNPPIDLSTHGFMVYEYFVVDGLAHAISAAPGWVINKIKAYAGANPSVLRIFNAAGNSLGAVGVINIAAGGCYELEPEGTYRQNVEVSGNGSRVYIEFFYAAQPDGSTPAITVNPP